MAQKKAHFIGIAGMGMSATAILLKEQGWEVSGSDAEAYPPATTQLERHGILYRTSYDAKNIPHDVDVIVIGRNAKLTREENLEVKAAYDSGTRIASFPELLGELLKGRESIVVAGSYGKSTTTALIAWCLSRSGIDIGWFVGASPSGMEPSRLGSHSVFVVEGDEYPTSHEDARPKFAHYPAHDCLLTAATHDHVNVYKTHEEFLAPFRELISKLPQDSALVFCADEPNACALAKKTTARSISYGFDANATYRAENITRGATTTFDLMKGSRVIAKLSTKLIGNHNIQNIVGASAMLLENNLLTPEQIADAISSFEGLARRLDKKTTRSAVPAYEAFGSSREKLRAAIAALKTQYPDKRLVVIFEPHTFGWRNSGMLHWFDDGFSGAASVILYKPAEQGASTHEQSSQEEMGARLTRTGVAARSAKNPDEAMSAVKKEIREGDVVLLSSSGAMDGLIDAIPKWLDNTFV